MADTANIKPPIKVVSLVCFFLINRCSKLNSEKNKGMNLCNFDLLYLQQTPVVLTLLLLQINSIFQTEQ